TCGVERLLHRFESEWSAIPAEPNGGEEKYGCEEQSDPEARRTQIFPWRDLRDGVHAEGERFRSEPQQTVFQHREEMRSVKRDLLEETDPEQRQNCPKKCRTQS